MEEELSELEANLDWYGEVDQERVLKLLRAIIGKLISVNGE